MNNFHFLFRQQITIHFGNTDFAGNIGRYRFIIPGEHGNPFDAQSPQLRNRRLGFLAHGIGHGNKPNDFPVAAMTQRIRDRAAADHQHGGFALFLQAVTNQPDGW